VGTPSLGNGTGGLPATVKAADVRAKTEERMARMIVYIRSGTTVFVYLPLIGWGRLEYPAVALGVALAATAEAVWFFRRAWRHQTTQDPRLVWTDVFFCMILMIVGSRAAFPMQRNVLITELVPFALTSPACVGFGLSSVIAGVAAVAGLMATWGLSVIPDVTLKLASDLLGFALWYGIALLVGRELRSLSDQTAQAQDTAIESARWLAEQQAEIARHQVHDVLLPIVEQIAAGAELSDDFIHRIRREADRARQLLDPRIKPGIGLQALLREVCENFIEAGLRIEVVIDLRAEPPAEAASAIAAATREALNNARKHAQSQEPVLVRADGGQDGVEVVIRDRGKGFDRATVVPGGGLGITFRAVSRYSCDCQVDSSPGEGTKVTIRWRPESLNDNGE
jgi:signal transduction histidine kinase